MIREFYVADAWLELPKLFEKQKRTSDLKPFNFIIADPMYDLPSDDLDTLDYWFNRLSINGYIAFSAPENPFISTAIDIVHHHYWIKPTSTKNYKAMKNPSRFVELIQYSQGNIDTRVWNGKDYHWSMSTNVHTDIVHKQHHGEGWTKPLALIERLIKLYTNPGDIVLDPFAGSGVVAEACMRLDRQFVCFDINEEYVTEAKERLGITNG